MKFAVRSDTVYLEVTPTRVHTAGSQGYRNLDLSLEGVRVATISVKKVKGERRVALKPVHGPEIVL